MNEHNNTLVAVEGGRFEFNLVPVGEAFFDLTSRFGFSFMIFAGNRVEFFDGNVISREPVFEMFTQRNIIS